MKIAIVLPVYNEEKHIKSVLGGLKSTNLTLVVVDDGSTDKTQSILSGIMNKEERRKDYKNKTLNLPDRQAGLKSKIVILTHKVNLGKGATMKTGAEYAFSHGYEAVIFMDSDNQHNPNDLMHFIDALDRGYEVIYGSRNMQMGMPLVRYVGNKFASIMVRQLFGCYVSDILCGYRAITKNAYKNIKWESAGYAVETEMIIRAAKKHLKFIEVPVQTLYHDNFKGVTILDALGIFFDVIRWRIVL